MIDDVRDIIDDSDQGHAPRMPFTIRELNIRTPGTGHGRYAGHWALTVKKVG